MIDSNDETACCVGFLGIFYSIINRRHRSCRRWLPFTQVPHRVPLFRFLSLSETVSLVRFPHARFRTRYHPRALSIQWYLLKKLSHTLRRRLTFTLSKHCKITRNDIVDGIAPFFPNPIILEGREESRVVHVEAWQLCWLRQELITVPRASLAGQVELTRYFVGGVGSGAILLPDHAFAQLTSHISPCVALCAPGWIPGVTYPTSAARVCSRALEPVWVDRCHVLWLNWAEKQARNVSKVSYSQFYFLERLAGQVLDQNI